MTGSSGNSAQGDWNPSHWEDYERVLRGDSADKAFMIAWPKLFYLKLGEIIWVKRDLVKCDWANCYHTGGGIWVHIYAFYRYSSD